MEKKKIWIDTDVGGDIDDALAITLAMAVGADVVGVGTVFENTLKRAKIAKWLLCAGGYGDVPVYAGEGLPIKARSVHGKKVDVGNTPLTYLGEKFGDAEVYSSGAVEAMRDAAEACPGMILVTLGALTNVAKFAALYPDSFSRLGALYIMGGARRLNLNEFNFTCDPEAADVVFGTAVKKYVITLDCTFRCTLSKEQTGTLGKCGSDLVATVMKMSEIWSAGVTLHDPLALACALGGDFVKFDRGNLKVELEGEYSRGKCVDLNDFNWKMGGRDDMFVSADVDGKAFTDYYVGKVAEFDKKLKSGPISR